MQTDCEIIIIFPIYGQFGAIQKPESQGIVCRTYIFVNSNPLSYKNWKQNSSHTTALRKGIIFGKKCWFFVKINADISTIEEVMLLKGIFSETTYVCVVTYQISSF